MNQREKEQDNCCLKTFKNGKTQFGNTAGHFFFYLNSTFLK